MKKTRALSTLDLELRADMLGKNPTAQDIEDAREALYWCARVINAADQVVREEALILAAARKKGKP